MDIPLSVMKKSQFGSATIHDEWYLDESSQEAGDREMEKGKSQLAESVNWVAVSI